MKKLMLLSLAVLFTMASCKEDEKGAPVTPNSELILGSWDLDRMHFVEYENGTKVFEGNQQAVLNFTFFGNQFLVIDNNVDTVSWGAYQLTSDSLLLRGADPVGFKLIKLTATNLELYLEESYVLDSTAYRDETTVYFTKNK